MRLGECHGAEEAALEHRLQEALPLLVGAEGLDQVRGAHAQHWVGAGGDVGRLEMREAGPRQQVRQLHAAVVEAALRVVKARLDKGVHGRLDLGNQHRFAVDVLRLVLVGLAVVRCEVFLGDGARGADGGVEGFAAVIGEVLAAGQGLGVQHFVEFECQVTRAEQGLGHGQPPFLSARV